MTLATSAMTSTADEKLPSVNLSDESAANKPHQPGLWDVLGGLRFTLATVVLSGHLQQHFPVWGLIDRLYRLSAPAAVFCFLTISGFSIAHSVARETSHFYRRRLLRIYPVYLAGIAVGWVIAELPGGAGGVHTGNLVANLFFLQTFVAEPFPANGVVWSLAIEVACYAMAPLLWRLSTRSLVILAGISAFGFMIYPRLALPYYGAMQHGGALFFLFWAWMLGFIYYRCRNWDGSGVIVLATFITLTTMNGVFAETRQHILISLTITLMAIGGRIHLTRFVARGLNYLGALSYPLYLLHGPIMVMGINTLHWGSPYLILLVSLLASAGARFRINRSSPGGDSDQFARRNVLQALRNALPTSMLRELG